ncbi:hypothetical protein M0M57_13460 [Flavobacterium azooxidireducens]|uniref:CHAT domain-containing protein n=1 Tax=Flavobacterium azooxidireducens TaxID=1871076 RepID=A0ABY4KCV6_9FLAO|nr:hypothetical protein [Flavobacterium azooxidireducens]UPQ78624.1 hypothetical protein M0M57_13460 [Flavobacterium azooxidireducens]
MRKVQIPDPFTFNFRLDDIILEFDYQNLDKEDLDFINFSIECNKIYLDSIKIISNIFASFENKEEVLDFVFKSLNEIYLQAHSDIFKKPFAGDTFSLNAERLGFVKYNNQDNVEINAKDILERGGDILNILIFILENEEEISQKIEKSIVEEEKNFYAVWYCAGNIYSFKSFYEILIEDRGSILIDEDLNLTKIKLSDQSRLIRTLSSVSEIRDRNHVNEYSVFANGFKNKNIFIEYKILNYNVTNGNIHNINFEKNNGRDENEILDFSRYLKTNKYLENLNFEYYDGLKLIEIHKVIIYIERIVNFQIKKKNSFSTAFKINKQELINYLSSVSNLNNNSIDKVIDAITEKSEEPYFWRKPLYYFNETIYLSFSLLSAPNVDLLFESIIEVAKIEKKEKIINFKKEIIEGLNIDNEYKFDLINISNDKQENNIVYELRDYFLIIEVVVLEKMPIESSEINDSLNYVSESVEKIQSKIQSLKKVYKEKDFVPIIVLNYSIFSGMFLDGVSIFDKRLLNNYFVTGEFQRGRINYGSKSKKNVVYNIFSYYENEDEFNNAFLNFQIKPLPIMEILSKLYWKEQAVFPNSDRMQLYIDVCDYVDERENLEIKINQLNNVLNLQYYNSNSNDDDKLIDKTIQYYLTDIFNLLAHSKYEFGLNRNEISKSFQKINIRGFAHLIHYFTNTLNNLESIKVKNTKTFNSVKFETEDTYKLMDKLLVGNNVIRLSEFKSDTNLNKVEEKQIITLNLEVLATVTITRYLPEDFNIFLLSLAIIKNYKDKYNLHFEFYSAVNNIISSLNFNNYYQTARNLSEEVLLISIDEKRLHRGWGVLFVCYEQQKNIFDASIYGCLYITAISLEEELTYHETVELFFNVLKFSRNIFSKQLVQSVFKYLKSINLKEYDEQKVHLSYYLSAFLNSDKKDMELLMEDSFNYFKFKSKKIIKFNEKGILPWLNYFYNIKRLIDEGVIDNRYNVDDYIELLESKVSSEQFLPFKEKHFSNENLKNNFIDSLKKTLNTAVIDDFVFENQNLELDMHNLVREGIINHDFESILLSGFIANDISPIYKNIYYEKNTVVPLIMSNKNFDFLNNYLDFIKSKIYLKDNQLFIYLFNSNGEVYFLTINSKKEFTITKANDWSIKKMNKWQKEKKDFYFNSKKYFDVNEQEIEYKNLINELSYTNLDLNTNSFDELLISTSIELSNFPINLIVNNDEFLGSSYKLSNVMLLEWFIENNEDYTLEKNFTSTCWAPIEEGDPDINYGYDKLKHVLEANQIKTIINLNSEHLNSNINIFFAHGELNGSSFKAIYKSQENYSAIMSNEFLFGSGDIAILFVCHSGKMDKNFFSNRVTSLVHEIINFGYKTVIAPCWALEVTIPEFWLDEFIKKFKTGVYISEAVYYANNELSNYKESISSAYFVAEGRLAMHLYGNPNVRIKN